MNTKLDKRPSEYITEFKSATKSPYESYSAFAHRLKELYKKGTECEGTMGQGERRLLVEQFLEGLNYSESMTLKMVATDAEMLDVDQLALRAARSGKPKKTINTIALQSDAEEDAEDDENEDEEEEKEEIQPEEVRKCYYCEGSNHGWLGCILRVQERPYWRPDYRRLNEKK